MENFAKVSEDAMEHFIKVAEDAMENFVKVAEDAGPSLHSLLLPWPHSHW
jgi:hypothetical protein